MFRLTTKLAQRINPDLEPRFDEAGWEKLRQALEIRNRITHPKSLADLEIAELDLLKCEDGFDWLFDLCLTAMEHANVALALDTKAFKSILEELKRSDPAALAAYRAAQESKNHD